jgi:iron complex transport system substrate-binding protein
MLYALGLGDSLVAVTHECDYPQQAQSLPHLTKSVLDPGLSASEIDHAVRERVESGQPLYELDEGLLNRVAPDLVVTQAVCAVCAVSFDDVVAAAARLESNPRVLSLDPATIGEVLSDIRALADAADVAETGARLCESLAARLDRVKEAVSDAPRPRVLSLEWLDPPFVAGHWVPQMIELAGGEDLLGMVGEDSSSVEWDAISRITPDLVCVMPCGYDAQTSAQQARDYADHIKGLGAQKVAAVDAAAYFSRPGPRLVDGVELLAHILHPELIDAVGATAPVMLTELATRTH